MKKIISFLLVAFMVCGMSISVFATNDYTQGTQVSYEGHGSESYTVTVPAQLAPGQSGTVTLSGTWASDRTITVTAQKQVTLVNGIDSNDQKTLDVTFSGIEKAGDNTESKTYTETVSVAEMPTDVLFGTWSGQFYYNVNIYDNMDYLQTKYAFAYYTSLSNAVSDVNNGTIGANADVDKENAVAGIYTDENGRVSVVVLKDATSERLNISSNMTLNLNGHRLSFTGVKVAIGISGDASTECVIDGSVAGSTIDIVNTNGYNTKAIQIASGNCLVLGGTYAATAANVGAGTSVNSCILVAGTGTLIITDAKVVMNNVDAGHCASIVVNAGTTANITNCTIETTCASGIAYAVDNLGSVTIEDCKITASGEDVKIFGIYNDGIASVINSDVKAYSDYTSGTGDSIYDALSTGIASYNNMTINNCYVVGTHSGLESAGTINIDGGVYEGYGHGGFYFIADTENTVAHVKNATIRQCDMPSGYVVTESCNNAGFYIGGNTNSHTVTVYMDNCDIYGKTQPIVLRGTSGENNNSLYISNSNINLNYLATGVRIDNDTHKVYMGVGNNFTVSDTNRESAVIKTNETYVQ